MEPNRSYDYEGEENQEMEPDYAADNFLHADAAAASSSHPEVLACFSLGFLLRLAPSATLSNPHLSKLETRKSGANGNTL